VGLESGVPLADMVRRASTLRPAPHRGEVRALPSGATVIDDAYNANPPAVERALEVLANATGVARKVAVLGEMLELGRDSGGLHARCGRAAARAGVSVLIAVGGEPARALADAAREAGVPDDGVRHVATSDEAAELAVALVREGDLVLVKGSRGIRLEKVVERLDGAAR
jgi:UDP-N-acetylmuramoyl-tripeptide--D-alanyl-D-alanine ligase